MDTVFGRMGSVIVSIPSTDLANDTFIPVKNSYDKLLFKVFLILCMIITLNATQVSQLD